MRWLILLMTLFACQNDEPSAISQLEDSYGYVLSTLCGCEGGTEVCESLGLSTQSVECVVNVLTEYSTDPPVIDWTECLADNLRKVRACMQEAQCGEEMVGCLWSSAEFPCELDTHPAAAAFDACFPTMALT